MRAPEHGKLTVEAFLEAIAGREGRYELVGGIAYALAGAKEGHNVICSNVLTALVPAGKAGGVARHRATRPCGPVRKRYVSPT